MRALSIPFRTLGRKVIAQTQSYEEVVRGQVIDALMTNQGERVFRPRYGCDIQAALFDPRDDLVRRDAATLIQARLEALVIRCIVRSINVELPPDSSIVNINIVYRPSPTSSDLALTVPVPVSEFADRLSLPAAEEVS
jgi:phage baseplate assembly protein W